MMAGGLPRGALRLAFIVLAVSGALGRQIPVDPVNMYDLTASGKISEPTHSWPRNLLFIDSWVRKNIAVTYAHRTRDGVGAQTMRLMGIYAIAKSLDLQYLHRPIQCVGHVDGRVHFRDSDCGYLSESDRRLMNKIRHMVTLPSNVTEEQVAKWEVEYMEYAGWNRLSRKIRNAYLFKRPTLLTIEFPTYLLQTHPDMYFSVPAFRPEQPSARLVCRAAAAQDKAIMPGRSWLLNALRISVHVRRGDIAENKRWRDRILPASYYVNVVKSIVEVMDDVGCDFTVEVYTETPSTAEGKAEIQYLKENMPSVVMFVSTDLSWSWQMMTTADVLIMSNSAFSLSAAIMNPNALNIFFPNAKKGQARIYMDHWFTPTDMKGALPPKALETLRTRLLMFQNTKELPPLQGPYNVSQDVIDAVLPDSMTIGYSAVHQAPAPVSVAARPPSNRSISGTVSFLNLFGPLLASPAANQATAASATAVGTNVSHSAAAALQEDVAPDAASDVEAQELLDETSDPFEFDIIGASADQTPVTLVPGAAAPVPATSAAFDAPAPSHTDPTAAAAAQLAGTVVPAAAQPAPALQLEAEVPGSLPPAPAAPAPMVQL